MPAPTCGATVCNAAITYAQKDAGWLSVSSGDSHATERRGVENAVTHSVNSVVLPKPAGAEISVSRVWFPRLSCSLSRARATRPGRSLGMYNLVWMRGLATERVWHLCA